MSNSQTDRSVSLWVTALFFALNAYRLGQVREAEADVGVDVFSR